MKTDLKAKYIQHLINKKKNDEGFTLIELLVVIIIIGILSAIALPSFLNQANKARESEAKQYVGAANRAQQAYYLERQTFTTDFQILGLGLDTATQNYSYELAAASTGLTQGIGISAKATNNATLRDFAGGVSLATSSTNETTTLAVLCQDIKADSATSAAAAGITFAANTAPVCKAPMEEIQ